VREPFALDRKGRIRVKLDINEVAVLGQLVPLLVAESPSPTEPRGRLPVYPGSPGDDEEFWRLMGSELTSDRADDRTRFEETLGGAERGAVLSEGEAESWLRVLGEARLVLAVRLGINEESDYDRARRDGGAEMATLDYLGYLQASLAMALTRSS
jgi:Domain of unknown function (DUF2017)